MIWGVGEIWKNNRQGIYASNLPFILLAINVPSNSEQSPKALENFFADLIGSKSTLLWKEIWFAGKFQPVFSLEIASTEGRIQYYVRTQVRFRDMIEASIYAEYPEAEIDEVEDYMSFAPKTLPDEKYDMWGTEFKLKQPNYLPIRTFVDFEDRLTGELKDPLAGILEHLAKMAPGEHFWLQFLIQPADNDWKEDGIKFINQAYGVEEKDKPGLFSSALTGILSVPNEFLNQLAGVSFLNDSTEDSKEEDPFKAFRMTPVEKTQVEAVLNKISKMGYHTKVRIVYIADKRVFSKSARAPVIKGLLNRYANLNLNAYGIFGPSTPKDDYFWQKWSYYNKQSTLLSAVKSRSFGIGATPGILCTEELATLWHFPTINIKAPMIEKAYARRAEPPVGLPLTFEEIGLPTKPKEEIPSVLPIASEDDKLVEENDLAEIPEIAKHFDPDFNLTEEDSSLPKVSSPTKKLETNQSKSSDLDSPPNNLPV